VQPILGQTAFLSESSLRKGRQRTKTFYQCRGHRLTFLARWWVAIRTSA
jgi:hypothetical protein